MKVTKELQNKNINYDVVKTDILECNVINKHTIEYNNKKYEIPSMSIIGPKKERSDFNIKFKNILSFFKNSFLPNTDIPPIKIKNHVERYKINSPSFSHPENKQNKYDKYNITKNDKVYLPIIKLKYNDVNLTITDGIYRNLSFAERKLNNLDLKNNKKITFKIISDSVVYMV